MTRYSRSAIPGRPAAADEGAALDRMVFGGKRRGGPAPANDAHEPDFLAPVDHDEADLLVARSNSDRRKAADRRDLHDERRRAPGRRAAEYAPLREDGRIGMQDDSKRGPMLLVGALLIVAVFGFVVWNAYRDGLQTDTVEVTPELSTAGVFKTPPRMVADQPIASEPIDEPAGALDGAPDEERPVVVTTKPAVAVVTPVPVPVQSKVTAVPPSQLTTPPPAKLVDLPKPIAAAPAPAPIAGAGRPGFQSQGDHVVQIAATSTQSAAELEWANLQKSNPDLLTGGEKLIVAADVGGKTVYRVRVGSFASKADASAFCSAFKARGGKCFPAVK